LPADFEHKLIENFRPADAVEIQEAFKVGNLLGREMFTKFDREYHNDNAASWCKVGTV
jgi:hypothetical protein